MYQLFLSFYFRITGVRFYKYLTRYDPPIYINPLILCGFREFWWEFDSLIPNQNEAVCKTFSIRFADCFLFFIHCKRPGASRELLPGHARPFLFQLRIPKWIRPAGYGLRRTHSRSSADSPDTETRGCWRCSGEAGHWHPRRQTA